MGISVINKYEIMSHISYRSIRKRQPLESISELAFEKKKLGINKLSKIRLGTGVVENISI